MKIARVLVKPYNGWPVGKIHDVFPVDEHPGTVLEGTLVEVEVSDDFDASKVNAIVADDGSINFVTKDES